MNWRPMSEEAAVSRRKRDEASSEESEGERIDFSSDDEEQVRMVHFYFYEIN